MSARRLVGAITLLAAIAPAATIVSRDASPSQLGFAPGWQAVSWTQTGSYTNESISARTQTTIAFNQSTGTAYLLNSLGPGTTAANELAPPVGFTTGPSPTPLFSGLTLGPGTYYLLIDSVQGQAGWGQANYASLTEVLDSGVSNILQYQPSGAVAGFSPATAFTSYDPKTSGNAFAFAVTGDRAGAATGTPEPASFGITLAGAAAVLLARYGRRRTSRVRATLL